MSETILKFTRNPWKYWYNETDVEILFVVAQTLICKIYFPEIPWEIAFAFQASISVFSF